MSTNVAKRSARAGLSISSTFSAFDSPLWDRLKLPVKTVSSATRHLACMKSCTEPGLYGVERLAPHRMPLRIASHAARFQPDVGRRDHCRLTSSLRVRA